MCVYRFQIATLATKLGVRNISFLGSGLLLLNYIAAILAAIYMPQVYTSNKKLVSLINARFIYKKCMILYLFV